MTVYSIEKKWELKGHGHGSESLHTSSVYRKISLMRCILKTGEVSRSEAEFQSKDVVLKWPQNRI